MVVSLTPPTRDLACNASMFPDKNQTSNLSVVSQASTQSTEPHQPGQLFIIYDILIVHLFVCGISNRVIVWRTKFRVYL